MSLARKQALVSFVLWSAVLIGLTSVLVLLGPERFSSPEFSRFRTLTPAVLLPAYIVSMWMMLRERRGRLAGEVDERDERIARRASEITLLSVALIIFLLCVVLWTVYEDAASAPAGWFYVLAYTTIALVALVHAGARLACEFLGSSDA